MSLFPKKVECSFKETELHCLASHWLMRVWSCVVCCESSLSSSESIRESTLVSVHESCDVILLMFNDGESSEHRFSWMSIKTQKNSFSSNSRHVSVIYIVLNEWKCFICVSSAFSADVLHPRWTHSRYCAVLQYI